jgi:hypothetical protein
MKLNAVIESRGPTWIGITRILGRVPALNFYEPHPLYRMKVKGFEEFFSSRMVKSGGFGAGMDCRRGLTMKS